MSKGIEYLPTVGEFDDTTAPVIRAMRAWIEGARVLSLNEQFASFGRHYRSYRSTWASEGLGAHSDFLATYTERTAFINEFGFAVPNAEAIDLLLAHSPLLEIGAGSGSWSRLLRDRGADIIATDPGIENFGFPIGRYHPVIPLAGKTAVRRWPERNVFCAWPSLNQTWMRQAARAMRPSRILLVVREDATADDRTWAYMDTAFRFLDGLELLSWQFCHDRLEAYVKLGSRSPRTK